jgi:uncharacterized protein YbaP (TraB family)
MKRITMLGLAAAMLCAGRAPAEPALWSVRDADSTIYLFGTAHAVRKDSRWRSPKIDAAMARSTELWLEIADDLGQNQEATAGLMRRLGFDPARPLSRSLPPALHARLAKGVAPYGVSVAQLEPMRPWLAAMTIGILPIAKAGLDTTAGADRALREVAVAEKDVVRGFETVEQQLRFLADMSEAEQVAFLASALDSLDEGTDQIAAISAAWEKGDVDTLGRIVVEDLKKEEPLVYRRLIVDRNVAWAARIRKLLAGKGTTFVAVGVAHLVGPDSVQAQLRKVGVRAVRN